MEWIDRFCYCVMAGFIITIAVLALASFASCSGGLNHDGPTLEPLRPFPTSTTTLVLFTTSTIVRAPTGP